MFDIAFSGSKNVIFIMFIVKMTRKPFPIKQEQAHRETESFLSVTTSVTA